MTLCLVTIALSVKHLPVMQETWVQLLDQEDPLAKEVATHSSVLAWRIPWTEGLAGCSSWDPRSQTELSTLSFFPSFSCTSWDHCNASGFSPLPFKLLHPALHCKHMLGTQHSQGNGMTQKGEWAGEEQRAVGVSVPALEPECHPK